MKRSISRLCNALLLAAATSAAAEQSILLPLFSKHQGDKPLNEQNFGLGYERNGWFGLILKDSHYKVEPFVGYNFRWQRQLGDTGFHTSLTLSTFLTYRWVAGEYRLLPAALPFTGIGYGPWTAEVTYVPTNRGAAFLMLRRSF